MANILITANQKGGVGKTFITVALAHIFASGSDGKDVASYKRKAERVLIVDCDAQGDATFFATQQPHTAFEEAGKTIVEAMVTQDARPYIHQVNETLSVLPASTQIAILPQLLTGEKLFALDRALQTVADDFDWILIDVKPDLGQMQLQALHVSLSGITNVLIPLQPRRFGASSIEKFAQSLHDAMSTNSMLNVLAVVPSMVDVRRRKDLDIINDARNMYGSDDGSSLVTEAVIRNRSDLEEMVDGGFSERKASERRALADFYALAREVKQRVKQQQVVTQ